MKIAFVGKGGAGKTTYSALFSLYLARQGHDVLLVDADINLHLPELLGAGAPIPENLHISHPDAAAYIKTHLMGDNRRIASVGHFKKSTPPGRGSRLIDLTNPDDLIISRYATTVGNLKIMAVGTYDADDVGASCYHNNLAILENVLSHTVDNDGVLVADMVAGIDAFSNTLHAQFDLLVLAVEPTTRGLEVYRQYQNLASAAGVADRLMVVGNKVADAEDEAFIRSRVPAGQYLGSLGLSRHLARVDKGLTPIDIDQLEPENTAVLEAIEHALRQKLVDPAARLAKLRELHQIYVTQEYVKDRFGDLTGQIDPDFTMPESNHVRS